MTPEPKHIEGNGWLTVGAAVTGLGSISPALTCLKGRIYASLPATALIIFGLLILFCVPTWAELTDEHLDNVQASFDDRRDAVLQNHVSDTWPAAASSFIWNRLNFALSALFLDDPGKKDEANAAIVEARDYLWANPSEFEGMHWSGNLWTRIHELFHSESSHFPGRLSSASEQAIAEVLWRWAESRGRMADADPTKTWHIWESENHDAMHDSTSWGAALILSRLPAYRDRNYADGSTPVQQYKAWTAYLSEYLRERARRGLLVEISSDVYSKYTTQNWYNYFDFSEDPLLRHLAENILHLWWADWAVEQIDAVRGGSRARMSRGLDQLGHRDGIAYLASYYAGIGAPPSRHPGAMCLATSEYRLPRVIMDLILDREGKGSFEYFSRRMGLDLVRNNWSQTRTYILDPSFGGILRYTYVTPDFIMGTSLLEKRPANHWSGISQQNRWHGVIFRGNPDLRIFPQPTATGPGDRGNNEQWSVQRKGTLIAQKLTTSENIGPMRVFIPNLRGARPEEDGWVFLQLPHAYAAVRPAYGGYTWDSAEWMLLNDEFAPVIIEVVRESDFPSFADFKEAVKQAPRSHSDGVLTYTGLLDHGTFTFYTSSSTPPRIDGVPIDYAPPKVFHSPFLESAWASGLVRIHKGSRAMVLDFNFDPGAEAGLEPLSVPIEDVAQVSEEDPDRAFSTEPLFLRETPGSRKHIYTRFDSSGLMGREISSAGLLFSDASIQGFDPFQDAGVQIWGLTSASWNREAITWNNAPAHGSEGFPSSDAVLLGTFEIPDNLRGFRRDEFTRSQLGSGWTTTQGQLGIDTSRSALQATQDNSIGYYNEMEAGDAFAVEATLRFGLNQWSGIIFNSDPAGKDFYWFRVRPGLEGSNNSAAQVLKFVAGESVVHWNLPAPTQTLLNMNGASYVFRIQSEQAGVFTLSLLDNDIVLLSSTTTDDHATPPIIGGYGGVFIRSSAAVDSFRVGTPSAAGSMADLALESESSGPLASFLNAETGGNTTLILRRLGEGNERLAIGSASNELTVMATALRPVVSVETEAGGSGGNEAGFFRFQLDRPAPEEMEVYWIFGGDAEAGRDFKPLPLSMLIPAGALQASLPVEWPEDPASEPRGLKLFLADHSAYERLADKSQATLFLSSDPWDAWRYLHFTEDEFGDPSISGDFAAPGGDNVPNILKFVLDLDPWTRTPQVLPLPQLDPDGASIVFWRREKTGAVSMEIQVSGDLENWQIGEPYLEETVIETEQNREKVRIRYSDSTARRLFFRVAVRRQE